MKEERQAVDPWMTLAEVAEELRVNPATVRLWVSKGKLKASRAGMRKWIVRRSDLESMLAATNPDGIDLGAGTAAAPDWPPRGSDPDVRSKPPAPAARFVVSEPKHDNVAKLVQHAAKVLDDAFDASRYAPPSPGYLARVRAIADACEQFSGAILQASTTAGMHWRGRANFGLDDLPYELRAGGNRPRREGLWDAFDAAVETLSIAMTGHQMSALADGLREVGEALRSVADELERDGSWRIAYGTG